MTSKYKPGDMVVFREKKPGEVLERWWTTAFPAKLLRPYILDGYWWILDAKGRMVWVKETDLVVVEPRK